MADEPVKIFIGHAGDPDGQFWSEELQEMMRFDIDRVELVIFRHFEFLKHLTNLRYCPLCVLLLNKKYLNTGLFDRTVLNDINENISTTKYIPVLLSDCTWENIGFLMGAKLFNDRPLQKTRKDAILKKLRKSIMDEVARILEAKEKSSGDNDNIFLGFHQLDSPSPWITIQVRDERPITLPWNLPLPKFPDPSDYETERVKVWESICPLALDLYLRLRDAYISLELSYTAQNPTDCLLWVRESLDMLDCAERHVKEFIAEVNNKSPNILTLFQHQPVPALTWIDKCFSAAKQNLPTSLSTGHAARRGHAASGILATTGKTALKTKPVATGLSEDEKRRLAKAQVMIERMYTWMLQLVRYSYRVQMGKYSIVAIDSQDGD